MQPVLHQTATFLSLGKPPNCQLPLVRCWLNLYLLLLILIPSWFLGRDPFFWLFGARSVKPPPTHQTHWKRRPYTSCCALVDSAGHLQWANPKTLCGAKMGCPLGIRSGNGKSMKIRTCKRYTLWQINIAMENCPSVNGLSIQCDDFL